MPFLPFLLGFSILAPIASSDEKPPLKPLPKDSARTERGPGARTAKETGTPRPGSERPEDGVPPKGSRPGGTPSPDPEKARMSRRLRDLEAGLKRVEAENHRLRRELAERVEAPAPPPGSENTSPDGALAELKAGNARFVAGNRTRSVQGAGDPALRTALARGQAPFAVVVTCSDSRLADNLIFDQELGRLFTVREAGNILDLQGIASVEYAAEHLGSKLAVVLGHGSCGAVKAVMEAGSRSLPGNLWALQGAMAGLLDSVRHDPNETPAEHLGHLVEANASRQAAALLERSEILRHLHAAGKLRVVPAVYDLTSGKVRFLPPLKEPGGAAPAPH